MYDDVYPCAWPGDIIAGALTPVAQRALADFALWSSLVYHFGQNCLMYK